MIVTRYCPRLIRLSSAGTGGISEMPSMLADVPFPEFTANSAILIRMMTAVIAIVIFFMVNSIQILSGQLHAFSE